MIAQTVPPWVQFYANGQGQCRILVAQTLKVKKEDMMKPIFQGDPEEEPLMPPNICPLCSYGSTTAAPTR